MSLQDRLRTMFTLSDLPLDVLVVVINFLHPCDILDLRKVCRSLHCATSQRIVWLDAMNRMCMDNEVFRPTFPVSSMSILQLEYATTITRRWMTSACNGSKKNAEGRWRRIRHTPITEVVHPDINEPGRFSSVYLVPGGRYLVSFAQRWLAVWDLGAPLHFGYLQPLAVEPIRFFGTFLVHATPDGSGLRIMIAAPLRVNVRYSDKEVSIFEIYPASDKPRILRIAYHQIPHRYCMNRYSLSGDRLILFERTTLAVWDYKADLWAYWSIDADQQQIIVTESAIVLLQTMGVSVWPIPQATNPISPFSGDLPIPLQPPVLMLEYPNRNAIHSPEGLCDWYSGTLQPQYYDVRDATRDDGTTTKSRFKVVLKPDLSGGELRPIGTFDMFGLDTRLRICEDRLVAWWNDPEEVGVEAHIGPADPDDSESWTNHKPQEITNFTTRLGSGLEIGRRYIHASFCPISARLVFCIQEGSWNLGIIDFSPCPPKVS
ncbi:hypothetical protein B0H34DRAFT_519878 [Crassisporium funariophilum]|nr:hypothetical protein B0H34DRAFT_519878 [Crassisporium funariophilum]